MNCHWDGGRRSAKLESSHRFVAWPMAGERHFTLSQGQPLRFTTRRTPNSFGGGQTPDTTGKSADLGSSKSIDQWFDMTQFSQPAPFTFGNMARSTAQLRNASAKNLDFSLFKSFRNGTHAGGTEG